jgi:HlyD family secretion protein
LVALIAGGLFWWRNRHHRELPPRISGVIETDVVNVASRYGGRVTALHAQEGDPLTAGQLLVELDAAELHARRQQAAALLAELEAGPRTNEIAAAQADWQARQAELALAKREAQRATELFAQKTVAEEQRDQALARVNTLQAVVQAAQARYQLLREGTRAETLAQARARVAEIDTQLAEMQIRAPGKPGAAAGYVLESLLVKAGDVLAPHRPAATLLLRDRLWVRVYVPAPWLGRIQVGQTVPVRTDTPGQGPFTGVVEQINRQAEFTPRNVQTVEERIQQVFGIKIRLPASESLRAGMNVDVEWAGGPTAAP